MWSPTSLYSAASTYARPQLVVLARSAILSVLARIQRGQLVVRDATTNVVSVCGSLDDPTGAVDVKALKVAAARGNLTAERGSGEGKGVANEPMAELRVNSDTFWLRMLLFADMGFAESYMLGEISCDDIVSFFEIFIVNRAALSNGTTLFSSVASLVAGFARRTNTLANSRLHISAHYDISNEMFAAFLSPDMTYSCALWTPISSSDFTGMETLEQAQMSKLHLIISRARLRATDHVLEIGTGWGSFAIEAVRLTGCRVTSLTLSQEQKTLAEQRIEAAGFSDRIEVLLCDYRSLPRPSEPFDKVVSIEMLEAVGAEFLETYFSRVHELLKPDGGIGVFQCITIPEARYAAYARGDDFIRRYIFPGGHLPTVSQLIRCIDSGSKGELVVDSVKDIGPHYAKTLRCWRESFSKNFEDKIRPALLEKHSQDKSGAAVAMDQEDVDVFRRKWDYYFAYCEAGFRTKSLGDAVITVAREGTMQLVDDVPL